MDETVYKVEAEVILALRDHFTSSAYVVIPQVRNGAGFDANRTADAIVMSVWPSRGLDLFGIEVKVSRTDWLREVKNPKKADDIAKYCDFWVLAVGSESIVKDDELPSGWGLLVPGKKPGTLWMKVKPAKLNPEPLSRNFLAAILKRALDVVVPLAEVDAEINRRVAAAITEKEAGLRNKISKEFDPLRLAERNAKLEAAAEAFYESTGTWLSADDVQQYKHIARAMKFLSWSGADNWLQRVETDLKRVTADVGQLRNALPSEFQTQDNENAA